MRKATHIWIGFDPRETAAFAVARESIRRRATVQIPISGLVLDEMKTRGLYWRPTEKKLGRLHDVISEAPMSTEFAISRFLVPTLNGGRGGWELFMDCDMLIKGNLIRLFDEIEAQHEKKAVWCVKHLHIPQTSTKMDDQEQTVYRRKNWSSFMVFDCDHPGNKRLTPELVNSARGIDLHNFCWLNDDEIGELNPKWNYLVGHTNINEEPKVIHYTDGGPWFSGLENVAYADDWRNELNGWARGTYHS